MSFANYKKNRTDVANLSDRLQQMESAGKNRFKDDRFWSPKLDKTGNASVTIRFLPAPEGEDLPWVQYHDHNFDNDGNFFIELCPSTLGRECPVCKYCKPLWKQSETDESVKPVLQERKKKLHYIANILILKNKENPEDEGKVFLFRFGTKIFEKIKAQLKPKDEDDPKVNVFDFWEGADFRLDVKKVKGFNNYDDSAFRAPSALYKGDDAKLEAIYNQLHKLAPFVAEEKFKSYADLDKKFNEVISGPAKPEVQKKADELFGDSAPKTSKPKSEKTRKPKDADEDTAPWEDAVRKPASKPAPAVATTESEEEITTSDEEDLNYYDDLANQ